MENDVENEGRKQHTKRKDKDRILKAKLIDIFGYNDFKITWDDLDSRLGFNSLSTTRYQMMKLVKNGFLDHLQIAERHEGIWSPNIFRIVRKNEDISIPEVSDNAWRDINKDFERLFALAKKSAKLEGEVRELRTENQTLKNINKTHQQEISALRNRVLEITNVK
jgi:hypothetical protein